MIAVIARLLDWLVGPHWRPRPIAGRLPVELSPDQERGLEVLASSIESGYKPEVVFVRPLAGSVMEWEVLS